MVQASILYSLLFDAPPSSQDGFASPEVDISRCQVAYALVVAMVVVVVDEGGHSGFMLPFEDVVFEQDAVLQGLVPALDLSLRLGMHGRAANMFHAFGFEVFRHIASDVRRTIIAEQARFGQNHGAVAA